MDAALENDYDDLSEDGDLNVLDTELHFGGGGSTSANNKRGSTTQTTIMSAYGPGGDNGSSNNHMDLQQAYNQRKTELDDMIARRKYLKAERMKLREDQEDQVANLDDSFGQLSQLLQYRDKQKERKEEELQRRAKNEQKQKQQPPESGKNNNTKNDDDDMEDWDVEMRQYMMERKVQATDRTKTPEEIAKEQADRLHQLETRRLARMQGDFDDDDDDLSDIVDSDSDSNHDNHPSDRNKKNKNKYTKKKVPKNKKRQGNSAEDLDDDYYDDDGDSDDGDLELRFTGEGIVFVDKKGRIVDKTTRNKAAEDSEDEEDDEQKDAESDNDDGDEHEYEDDDDAQDDESAGDEGGSSLEGDDSDEDEAASNVDDHKPTILKVGTKVQGNYRAKEQFEARETWYSGVISKVHLLADGDVRYDVEYDDGDFEEDMEPENVRPIGKSNDEVEKEKEQKLEEIALKRKHQKAKEKARREMPFVFDVPTTLEVLHEMIATHASTGQDASIIIQRIHATNSVRLDRRNMEKMQNFYDVLLRRFIAVGDAIYKSGDGRTELGRFQQLDELTKVLYTMAQDSPVCAGAVWGRRIGILQNAHAKRLRDAAMVGIKEEDDDDDDNNSGSAWPSTGVILLLRALGHIFPVTDARHPVVTPTILMLGQMVAHTPVLSVHDIITGLLCCALLLEYTREAKRIVPEALAFLSSVIHLYAPETHGTTTRSPLALRSLEVAMQLPTISSLRECVSKFTTSNEIPSLSLERQDRQDPSSTAASILGSALQLVEACATNLSGHVNDSEPELFADVTLSLLAIEPKHATLPLPKKLVERIALTAASLSCVAAGQFGVAAGRKPLERLRVASTGVAVIKSLVPRMEDPSKYSTSKKGGSNNSKDAKQAALDRARREYKREKKAVSRELRLDAAIMENERRQQQERRDALAREKRQKNFAWLESEQATMNQQVRMGGGLLKGGGVGAAKAKAATAKLGIKKGGRF